MPSLFQRSSLTFGEAKIWVAEQHSKQASTEMLNRAGRAIQRAVKDWNRYKWEWLITSGTDVSVTAGLNNTKYPVPYNYRAMYSLVITQGGVSRALVQDTKRVYDRVMPKPMTSMTSAYNLVRLGDLGKFELQDPPNADGTVRMLYYRRMNIPCSVTGATVTAYSVASGADAARLYLSSTAGIQIGAPISVVISSTEKLAEGTVVTAVEADYVEISSDPLAAPTPAGAVTVGGDNEFLDIHVDFEWDLLARAVEHFLVSCGAAEAKLAYWIQAAVNGIEKAQAAQNDKDDRDLSFEVMPAYAGYNPNRIVE